jgi:hypothetical protein
MERKMKVFFTKIAWQYYAITLIVVVVLFILRETDLRIVGVAGIYGLCPVTLRVAIVVTFVIALILGFKNFHLKWMYPFFSSLFTYLILPLVAFVSCYRTGNPSDYYYLMYYLGFGFVFIFLIQLFFTLIGMKIGDAIGKRRKKQISSK